MAKKIPATVVTGFLGAGKTTLIRHLLATAEGLRIALVINEFGDIGVDGEILKGCGDIACREEDLVELSNGCICCTVADDFVPTIEKLIDRDMPPEHIVIETSGLALPQPLLRAFQWPAIRGRVTLDAVVAVVDGPAVAAGRMAADPAAVARQRAADPGLDHATPLQELFEDQVASADLLVVSKADLLGASEAAELAERLAGAARPGVRAVAAAHGALDRAVLIGLGAGAENDLEARREIHHHHHDHPHDHPHDFGHHHDHGHDHSHDHGHHSHHSHDNGHHDLAHDHGHDAFESFVVELGEWPDRAAALEAVARTLAAHPILRLKGFAAISGKPMRLVIQGVGPRVDGYFDRPFAPNAPRTTRLVVIGQAGLDRAAIAAALTSADEIAPEPAA
ncbi:MAG: cobalamin biosynthesis protein CobW [Pikeienuella sp.]